MTIQGAIAELQNLINADDVPFYYKGCIEKVIETISTEIPTTEQFSKVGEWIKQGRGRYRRCVCSVCGHGNGRKYNDNFCSNCGAKMKGESK